ncbi:MAG: lipid-A-disaccharide synthase [Thiotrichaceae bacterium]
MKIQVQQPLRIGMIAGEISGDLLGAGLIQALRAHFPNAIFEGIGGKSMQAAGFQSFYPLETLSVMGLVEVIKHYRTLQRCHARMRQHFLTHRPDIFIGIDAPDFNLGLELAFKQAGIPTVHYVSPSVWAWRRYRVKKIAQSCDMMLTLLPFEADFYIKQQIPVKFVGHPLADQIPLHVDKQLTRQQLQLPLDKICIALLPGSRVQEVQKLLLPFLQTAQWLTSQHQNLLFLIPAANTTIQQLILQQLAQFPVLPVRMLAGQSHEVMAAADVVLTASGTATLEAMLLKRPMVVAYRFSELTYQLARYFVHIRYMSLPNLLADAPLVPEFLQHRVIPKLLGEAILDWLLHPEKIIVLKQHFTELHHQLRRDANIQAADTIIDLLHTKHSELIIN